jgi:hypothetical protein
VANKKLFIAYNDLVFANNAITRHNDYGLCFSLFGGVIDYKAIKGQTVITFSTEVELLTISLTVKLFI